MRRRLKSPLFPLFQVPLLQTEIHRLMNYFAVLFYLTNRYIRSDEEFLLYFALLRTDIHGLMKNFALLCYFTKDIYGLMKNFAILRYPTKRYILSDEEFCCTFPIL